VRQQVKSLLITWTRPPFTCNAAVYRQKSDVGATGGESKIFTARSRLRRSTPPTFATLGAAIVIAGVIGQTPASPSASAESTPGSEDGNLAFTLDRVERDWVDPDHTRAPQGTWVLIPIIAKNVGDTAQTFRAEDQKLKEPGGQALSPDMNTMDVEFPGHNVVMIEPGSQSLVYLLFDVPFGVLPNKIELHESSQSPGATLDLP
jgi:Domain of unknown function (DUF4352)